LLENIRRASDQINKELLTEFQQRAETWGIHLTSIDIAHLKLDSGFTQTMKGVSADKMRAQANNQITTSTAQAARDAAKAKSQQTQIEAQAAATAITTQAEAQAAACTLKGNAEAEVSQKKAAAWMAGVLETFKSVLPKAMNEASMETLSDFVTKLRQTELLPEIAENLDTSNVSVVGMGGPAMPQNVAALLSGSIVPRSATT
jgi:regulator of protease activity HflC (stomatin/prohibitin superfamily)